jgi:hypothetical protein
VDAGEPTLHNPRDPLRVLTAELVARLDHHRAAPLSDHGLRAADDPRAGSGGTNPGLRILACGPNAMLWAVARLARDRGVPCFISVEEQMACGIGVCLGCAVPARSRPFRYVCKDGPVFDAADVLDVNPAASPAPSVECPS